MAEVDWKQVRQALEKLSFIDAVNLAKALAPKLYQPWETVVRILAEVADEALKQTGEEEEVVEEKTVVEEELTGQ